MKYVENLVETLSTNFGNLLPTVLGALLALIIGFFIAKLIRRLVKAAFQRTNLDENIAKKVNTTVRVDDFIAKIAYYIVVLCTLLIVLNILNVDSGLNFLNGMMENIFQYIPRVILAGIIGYVGYILGMIISEAGGFITGRLETFAANNGINVGGINIAKIVKQLIFLFIFIPILIVALDALKIDVISKPAGEMLSSFMAAVPNIIAAALIVGISYIAGKYIVGIVVELLKNLGLDRAFNEMGMGNIVSGSISKILGNIALFFIMFTGIIQAVEKLQLTEVSGILNNLFGLSGKIFFGMLVLFAGVYVSNIAVKAISKNGNAWLASIVRFATIGIFLAFALHTMGIAENIVELAFGLTLGAIAVAFALAFGLGGREAAGKELENFFTKLRK